MFRRRSSCRLNFRTLAIWSSASTKLPSATRTGSSTFPSSHQFAVPAVRLSEFLRHAGDWPGRDRGPGNWQQQIENNKQAFTAAFVQRSRFLSAFPSSLTAAEFVDRLNANAGNPLSSTERNQLVNDLSTNAKTRAQVLRAVAEDEDLKNAGIQSRVCVDAVLWLPASQSQRPTGFRSHRL